MTSPRLLNQDEAINIDQELFTDYRFSVDQLMELAGNINVFTSLPATFPIKLPCTIRYVKYLSYPF